MFFLGKKTNHLPSEIPPVPICEGLGSVSPNKPNPPAMSAFLVCLSLPFRAMRDVLLPTILTGWLLAVVGQDVGALHLSC